MHGEAGPGMDLIVGPAPASVGIAPHARRHQAVVEGGVDIGPHRLGRVDLDGAQRIVPGGAGPGPDRVEIARLAAKVRDRAILVHARQRDLHLQRFRQRAKVELRHQRAAGQGIQRFGSAARPLEPLVEDILLRADELVARHRHGKAHGEEDAARRSPTAHFARSGDRAVGPDPHRRPEDLAGIIIDDAAQVDQQVRRLAGREGVAVDADARSRGHFGPHAGVGQRHRIIARRRRFIGLVRAEARRRRVARLQRHRIAADRHDQEIAQVAMARTRKMRVGKA